MVDTFNLYKIISTCENNELLTTLFSYATDPLQVGPIRKDFSRNIKTNTYIESNRRIVLIKDSLFTILKTHNLHIKNKYDFVITPYQIKPDNYPPEDSTFILYFDSNEETLRKLRFKLKSLKKLGILYGDYEIKDKGIAILKDIDQLTYIKIKTILDDIEDGFRVSWCKKNAFKTLNI